MRVRARLDPEKAARRPPPTLAPARSAPSGTPALSPPWGVPGEEETRVILGQCGTVTALRGTDGQCLLCRQEEAEFHGFGDIWSTSQRAEEFAGLREDLPDRRKNHNAVGVRLSLEQLLGCSLGLWSVLCPCVPMTGLRPPAFSCLSVLSLGGWQ